MNIDKDKIQRKLKVHEILLDIYFTTKIIIGQYMDKIENVEKCVM